ncbi:hypothetical protein Hanom_Chr03g00211911 [Helianthus anomalus]
MCVVSLAKVVVYAFFVCTLAYPICIVLQSCRVYYEVPSPPICDLFSAFHFSRFLICCSLNAGSRAFVKRNLS